MRNQERFIVESQISSWIEDFQSRFAIFDSKSIKEARGLLKASQQGVVITLDDWIKWQIKSYKDKYNKEDE